MYPAPPAVPLLHTHAILLQFRMPCPIINPAPSRYEECTTTTPLVNCATPTVASESQVRARTKRTDSSCKRFKSPGRLGQSRLDMTSFTARMYQPTLATLVFFASTVFRIAEACSSRSTPKPRPPSQSARPNITFPTFECPREYQNYYCLNGARCFTVKIENNILYNCECADGFTGPRCEFKDLDGSYLPNREKVMIETASIAGGVTVAVLLIVIFFIAVYVYVRRREKKSEATTAVDSSSWRPFEKPSKSKPSKIGSGRKSPRNSRTPDPESGDQPRSQDILAKHSEYTQSEYTQLNRPYETTVL